MENKLNVKKYENIIMMGENCEPAFQFKRHFDFLESFPYNWCRIHNLEKFLKVFSDEKILWSNGVHHNLKTNMFMDYASEINFHGVRKPKEFNAYNEKDLEVQIEREFTDLKERTAHLLDKLHRVWNMNKSQLYVSALRIDDTKRISNFIDSLRNILNERTKNYELLIILNKNVEYSVGGGDTFVF